MDYEQLVDLADAAVVGDTQAVADFFNALNEFDFSGISEEEAAELLREVETSPNANLRAEVVRHMQFDGSEAYESIVASSEFLDAANRDGDDEVSYDEAANQRAAAVAAGDEGGASAAEEFLDSLPYDPWLYETFGSDLDEGRLLEQIAEVGGPTFTDLNEAGAWLQDEQNRRLLERMMPPEEEAAPAFEPFMKVQLTYGQDFDIKTADLERTLNLTGLDEQKFANVLQLADAYGLRRADSGELTFTDPRLGGVSRTVSDGGQIAWQPAVFLMNMTGHVAKGGTFEERQAALDRAQALRQQLKDLPSNFPEAVRTGLQRELDKALAEWRALAPGTERTSDRDPLTNLNLGGVFGRFTEGSQMYGGLETLGMLHAVDPQLAASLWSTKGQQGMLTPEQVDKAGYWLSQAVPGAGNAGDPMGAALVELGYGEASGDAFVADVLGQIDYVRNGGGVGGGGGGGRIRMTPDRTGVEQAARDLMEALYPESADDAQIQQITDRVISEAMSAPMDQSVDLNARVRQAVEELPQYEQFYGNKPGSVTDQQYRGVMEAGAQSMLGAESALTGAAGLGMESGKYQTAVGATAGTSVAWDNSTFMGRLARAAQVTSANT